MSLRQVLTIYNAERQLTDDETALLNTLRKMSDSERGMFVEGLSDKPAKKTGKKSASKGTSKSARASSLQQQIQATAGRGSDVCGASLESSSADCNLPRDHALHVDKGYVDYHPFESSSPARPAPGRSSSNKFTPSVLESDIPRAAQPSTSESNGQPSVSVSSLPVSSETETEDVSAVVGG